MVPNKFDYLILLENGNDFEFLEETPRHNFVVDLKCVTQPQYFSVH